MDIKSIFASKTFWGAVISLLGQFVPNLFTLLGVTPDAVVQWVVVAIGFGLTVYGRYKATHQVSVSGK